MAEIFTEDCYQSFSIFLKFSEVEYFVHKRVFNFPPFCFCCLFFEAFSIPIKNEICSEGYNSNNFYEQ